ncbi:hypothetical protein DYI37_11310 [Fulvimarina endophytica]|uniref:Uncharacterized protein n=1 Tax=Fulvimarina endophytica TaxID=2293836 RepID=A0A371X2X9_9HYPH|nr:hypothetical protein [Fulvimarina endophytica]RFC63588.1 hypothetical protein DYI37_11310 [Fulvimarina endophytica]
MNDTQNSANLALSPAELVLTRNGLDNVDTYRAIQRRLREAGLSLPVDKVISDARRGEAWALDILQTTEFPAPSDRLTMPVQELAAPSLSAWWSGLFGRAASASNQSA